MMQLAQHLDLIPNESFSGYASRLGYMEWARSTGILPDMMYDELDEMTDMESLCATEGWPSAVLTLETVGDDCPERPRPERAMLYAPMIATAELSLASLRNATIRVTGKLV